MKIQVFSDVTPCILVIRQYGLYLQGLAVQGAHFYQLMYTEVGAVRRF